MCPIPTRDNIRVGSDDTTTTTSATEYLCTFVYIGSFGDAQVAPEKDIAIAIEGPDSVRLIGS